MHFLLSRQFNGAAGKATDLYGLGATLLYLLSAKNPNEFNQTRLKIDFSRDVVVSEGMGDVLESLLEPAAEDRPTIGEVRAFMEGRESGSLARPRGRYASGRVRIERTFGKLEVTVLPDGVGGALSMGSFAVAWNVSSLIECLLSLRTLTLY